MSIYCIGDVHGCLKTLEALLAKIPSASRVVFTGDLVDRGPSSKGVVELVMSGGYQCVLGNHELFLLASEFGGKFSSGYSEKRGWISNGGDHTLQSYGGTIPESHLKWISELPLLIEFTKPDDVSDKGRRLVVTHSAYHTGFHKFKVDVSKNLWSNDSILWNRLPVYKSTNRYFVHGHTVQESPDVKSWYSNIDTGCVFNGVKSWDKKKSSFVPFNGCLTALQWPETNIISQPCLDGVYGVE